MMRENLQGIRGSREVNPEVVFSLGKLGLWAVITHHILDKTDKVATYIS